MRTKSLVGLVAVLVMGAIIAIVVWRDSSPRAQRAAASDEAETEEPQDPANVEAAPEPELERAPELPRTTPVVTASATAAAVPTPATLPDEEALMAKLHALGQADPEQSIRLARDGNRRFPKGSGASERAWIVSKSLTSLARFDEAREEAKKMVKEYPGTSWTMDVIKHILIQPGTHPSQRGYGQQLEGE